jgi:hypothetical protein
MSARSRRGERESNPGRFLADAGARAHRRRACVRDLVQGTPTSSSKAPSTCVDFVDAPPGTRKPTTTASTGAYRKRILDKPGKYQAKVLKTYVNRGFSALPANNLAGSDHRLIAQIPAACLYRGRVESASAGDAMATLEERLVRRRRPGPKTQARKQPT